MSVTPRKLENEKTVFDVRVQYGRMRVSRTVRTTMTDAKRLESKLLQGLMECRYEILKNRENPKFRHYGDLYKESITWHKSYRRTLVSINHLVKYFGNKRLTEITEREFIEYRIMRLKKVGVATVNRERACLLRMLNVAVNSDEYLIHRNPVDNVKQFKEPPAKDRVLTVQEYHKLVDAAPEYFRRIILFACHTGMRKMEILDLKFEQIKFWLDKTAEIELIETKSGDKEYVPLDNEVIELLLSIAKERGIDVYNLREEEKSQHVFTGMRGQRLKSVRKPMMRTFKKADIEFRPFHTFRHFWTKMMFEAGNDPATIQKVGRWRDFQTMIRYCYTTRKQEHEAVNKLPDQLGKKVAKIVELKANPPN